MLYVPIGSRWFGPDHPRPWVELKAPGAEWQLTEFTWTAPTAAEITLRVRDDDPAGAVLLDDVWVQ